MAFRSLWNPKIWLRNPQKITYSIFSRSLATSTTGTVKFYMRDKGYGFINPDGRDDVDLFVHRNNIDCSVKLNERILSQSIRFPYLKRGERVRFVVTDNNGLETATNVTWLDGKKIPPERSNFLGGVHQRVKRTFGEQVFDIMGQEGLNNDTRIEKVFEAFVEAKRNIQNAEKYIEKLGMNPSDFPTVRAKSGQGRYMFKKDAPGAGGEGKSDASSSTTKRKKRRRRKKSAEGTGNSTAAQPASQVPPEGLAAFEAAIAGEDSNEDEFHFDDLTSVETPAEADTSEDLHYETFTTTNETEQVQGDTDEEELTFADPDDDKPSMSFTSSTTVETIAFDFSTSEQDKPKHEEKEDLYATAAPTTDTIASQHTSATTGMGEEKMTVTGTAIEGASKPDEERKPV